MRKSFLLPVVIIAMAGLTGCTAGEVTYHGRIYVDPGTETFSRLEAEYGKLVPAGESVSDLPVYVPSQAKERLLTPTRLILKEPDGTCLVYDLSGGP